MNDFLTEKTEGTIHMKIFICIIVLLSFTASAEEVTNQEKLRTIVANSKVAGVCELFRQMIIFQQSAQHPKGDKFIKDFMASEAKRVGLTDEQYMDSCRVIIQKYDKTLQLIEKGLVIELKI